jgi:hypothetical protein
VVQERATRFFVPKSRHFWDERRSADSGKQGPSRSSVVPKVGANWVSERATKRKIVPRMPTKDWRVRPAPSQTRVPGGRGFCRAKYCTKKAQRELHPPKESDELPNSQGKITATAESRLRTKRSYARHPSTNRGLISTKNFSNEGTKFRAGILDAQCAKSASSHILSIRAIKPMNRFSSVPFWNLKQVVF